MAPQRYPAPREWLPDDEQHGFGVHKNPPTIEPKRGLEEQLHAAAILQHKVAKAIRDAARDQNIAIEDIAEYAGVNPRTVRNILNGTRHATFATVAVFAHAVGLELDAVAADHTTDAATKQDPSPSP